MDRKKKTIDYIDGHVIEDGVMKPLIKNVEVMMTGTKRFHNCLHLILGLGKLERILIDWISEEMDVRNIIRNDGHTRKTFIDFISKLVIDGEKKTYKDQSVNNAFHSLKDKKLLIPVSKGVYQVEPNFYWNSSDKSRIEQILVNIQFSSTETNFKVLDGAKYETKPKQKSTK